MIEKMGCVCRYVKWTYKSVGAILYYASKNRGNILHSMKKMNDLKTVNFIGMIVFMNFFSKY